MIVRPAAPLTAAALVAATLALPGPAAAGFFGRSSDDPVIYRPIVSPRVYYYQPPRADEVLPAPRHRLRTSGACRIPSHHAVRPLRRCR
ncbi:hypothetical protein [Phreatobacter sp. AB_2022a]|uniref:hypothetical protein n=1 Tax=Phreatobacter sp. AB_2022a TaxID=3003134 RepID=UPI002286E132|nr:hypothetical protein [Phreatobacter sp. AB_2022a]MCZ0734723.1 hypothetical protein [Phreatobacter sp. AB_2022a]